MCVCHFHQYIDLPLSAFHLIQENNHEVSTFDRKKSNDIIVFVSDWRFGALLCKLVPYLQGVSVCASVNTLAAIAIDR